MFLSWLAQSGQHWPTLANMCPTLGTCRPKSPIVDRNGHFLANCGGVWLCREVISQSWPDSASQGSDSDENRSSRRLRMDPSCPQSCSRTNPTATPDNANTEVLRRASSAPTQAFQPWRILMTSRSASISCSRFFPLRGALAAHDAHGRPLHDYVQGRARSVFLQISRLVARQRCIVRLADLALRVLSLSTLRAPTAPQLRQAWPRSNPKSTQAWWATASVATGAGAFILLAA